MLTSELRNSWLLTAESLKPVLPERKQLPNRVVATRQNEGAFQNWEMIEQGTIDSITKKTWGRKESFILDFGFHMVGYFDVQISSVGRVDAPLRLELVFGESEADIAAPFDPYVGMLGRGYLQDEVLNIAGLPLHLSTSRRYAFRYVKITVIDTSPDYKVRFGNISARSVSSADSTQVTPLSASASEALQKIDEVSLRTLANCMQTVFEDGPKRDRRLWIGDLRLQALVNYESFKNYDLVKRCLYLFAALVDESGRVPACLYESPYPERASDYILDYVALFPSTVLEYGEASHDWETAAALWPIVNRQVEILLAYIDNDGAFTDPGNWWIFIDWEETLDKQTAMHGAAIIALSAAAVLALKLSKTEESSHFSSIAQKMRDIAKKRLFSRELGLFTSQTKMDIQVSWASQVWMILAEVVDHDEAASVLKTVQAERTAVKPSSPYLYHYVIEAMLKAGLTTDAVRLLQEYWGGMCDKGATTFWEVYDPERPTFSPYNNHLMNSYCHAWSCTPSYFIRRYPQIFQTALS